MEKDCCNVPLANGTIGAYGDRVLLTGFILNREYVHFSEEIVKTDLSLVGRQTRIIKSALEAAVRTLGDDALPPGTRYHVDEIELVETKGVGPAIFLERRNEAVSESAWQQLTVQQQESMCTLMKLTLLMRKGMSNQLFAFNDEPQMPGAEPFAKAFNQCCRNAVELVLLDPRNIDPGRIVFLDALAKERPVVTSEPIQVVAGVVTGFRAGKNAFSFEARRGQGSIEIEMSKPADFHARLVVLYLSRQPCLLKVGVCTLHENSGKETVSYTLLGIEAVLENDWEGTMGMLSAAAEFLVSKSVSHDDWVGTDASSKSVPPSETGGYRNSKQKSVHHLAAAKEAIVSLAQGDADPTAPRGERAPRRRKKWDPF